MVQHDINGYRVKPGDVEALADAMNRLLASDALAEKFGEASYVHAINFSWDAAAEVLVDKISMLLDHDRLMPRPDRTSSRINTDVLKRPSAAARVDPASASRVEIL
jgi:hypothetical protein